MQPSIWPVWEWPLAWHKWALTWVLHTGVDSGWAEGVGLLKSELGLSESVEVGTSLRGSACLLGKMGRRKITPCILKPLDTL